VLSSFLHFLLFVPITVAQDDDVFGEIEELLWEFDESTPQIDVAIQRAFVQRVDKDYNYITVELAIIWNIAPQDIQLTVPSKWTMSLDRRGDWSYIGSTYTIQNISVRSSERSNITLIVDSANLIPESNETNNSFTVGITPFVVKIDAMIAEISYMQQQDQFEVTLCFNWDAVNEQTVTLEYTLTNPDQEVRNRTEYVSLLNWCQDRPIWLQWFANKSWWKYILRATITTDSSFEDINMSNNTKTFETTLYKKIPAPSDWVIASPNTDPIKDDFDKTLDIFLKKPSYNFEDRTITVPVCWQASTERLISQIQLDMLVENQSYTKKHTNHLYRSSCKDYIFSLPVLSPATYESDISALLVWTTKETDVSNNASMFTFVIQQPQQEPEPTILFDQQSQPRKNKDFLDGVEGPNTTQTTWSTFVQSYDLLAAYCVYENIRIRWCSKLFDLYELRWNIHEIMSLFVIYMDKKFTSTAQKRQYILTYRKAINQLTQQYDIQSYDTRTSIRMAFLFAYMDYSLAILDQQLMAPSPQTVKKYFAQR